MEVLGGIILFLAIIVNLGVVIYWFVDIIKGAGKHDQSVALWVILTFFFGYLGYAIYKFVTKRVGAGIFWFLGYPFLLFIALFIGFLLMGIGADSYYYY